MTISNNTTTTNFSSLPAILAGKKINIPTFNLNVVATPWVGIADNICSAETHYEQFSHVMHPADDLQLEIVYDDVSLESLNFPGNQSQETVFTLVDDRQNTDHVLKFIFSGKTDNHSYHTETKEDVSWILKLDLYIENLFVAGLLMENASTEQFDSEFYIGKNGTYMLTIQTPIYKWLFQYDDWFVRRETLLTSKS